MFHRSPPSDRSSDAERQKPSGEEQFAAARRRMVAEQLWERDISDARVLKVMGQVARERFVPAQLTKHSYEDHPLPIGFGQTISQPYIVALMAQVARPASEERALEIGVGSGYEAAVLAGLCQQVYGIEILDALAAAASERLARLGYANVTVRCGDGYRGWPDEAPFDVILVSAAPDHVPPPLTDQLAIGGRLVIPVGGRDAQELLLIEKRPDGSLHRSRVIPVQFVPMIGEARKSPAE